MSRPAPGAIWSDDTLSWRLNSRWFALLGGARAAILQVCDPQVAAGVAAYSSYRTDPLGRLERVHGRVQGTTADGMPYSASDPALRALSPAWPGAGRASPAGPAGCRPPSARSRP